MIEQCSECSAASCCSCGCKGATLSAGEARCRPCQIFAHRGASYDYSENSMAAYKAAIAQGADGIELDVQLSADGKLICIHDEDLQRLCGLKADCKDLSYAQLAQLPLLVGNKAGQTCTIPLLEEVLLLCKEHGTYLNIELKNSVYLYEGMAEQIVALIRREHMEAYCILSSFNHHSLKQLAAIAPEIELALLSSDILSEPWSYAKDIGVSALHLARNTLYFEDFVQVAHANGLKVRLWTVDEEVEIMRALAMGADAVITNRPERALLMRTIFSASAPPK